MPKPPILVSSLDLERLETLLEMPAYRAIPGADALRQELNRAEVLEPEKMPPTVVTMNSRVCFQMQPEGTEFELTLVYPRDANGDPSRISILAPVGSALLGLSVGQQIEWPVPGGRSIKVSITEVSYQPERVGDYHR